MCVNHTIVLSVVRREENNNSSRKKKKQEQNGGEGKKNTNKHTKRIGKHYRYTSTHAHVQVRVLLHTVQVCHSIAIVRGGVVIFLGAFFFPFQMHCVRTLR